MQYTVDTAAMGRAAVRVEQAASDISGYLGELTGELDQMFSSWSGEGADSHRDAHDRFDRDARQVTAALNKLHAALVATHRAYGSQEAEQRADGLSIARQINQ
jgi:WXG100 family type VII secretion target